jgi:hypothetical protein
MSSYDTAARPEFLFPSQYSSMPTISTSAVNPTIFTTARTLLGSSAAGIKDSVIVTKVVQKPKEAETLMQIQLNDSSAALAPVFATVNVAVIDPFNGEVLALR